LAALLVIFIAVILYVRHLQHKQQPPPDAFGGPPGSRLPNGEKVPDMPVAVSFATVTASDLTVRVPALGTVTPLATVTVRTQISGILQKIAFTEGQLVHQGDLLAQIDPRPYEAAVKQMEGNLRRDQALLEDARLDLKRYEGLVKEDSIAVQTLDTQRATVAQYEGTIESDEGQLNTAQVNLGFTRIVSPVTGRVGLRQVDQGNYVTPGDTNGIVVVNEVQPITVLFSIPEDNVGALVKRLHDGGTLKVEAYDRTNSRKLAEGRLLTADNAIDTTTGTIKMRAEFANSDGALFPNQFVNVQLLLETLSNQTIIPGSAVHRGAPKGVLTDFVYVVNDNATVSVRPVTLGVAEGDRVAVTAGLRVGERIVTEGGDRLRDGAPVDLPGAAQTRRPPSRPT
jgi:multidrug efflux system membrane fusion protein